MYLTHFGRIGQVQYLGERLIKSIHSLVSMAEDAAQEEKRGKVLRNAIREWLRDELKAHGWIGDAQQWKILLEPDIELNAQGLEFWLDQRAA